MKVKNLDMLDLTALAISVEQNLAMAAAHRRHRDYGEADACIAIATRDAADLRKRLAALNTQQRHDFMERRRDTA